MLQLCCWHDSRRRVGAPGLQQRGLHGRGLVGTLQRAGQPCLGRTRRRQAVLQHIRSTPRAGGQQDWRMLLLLLLHGRRHVCGLRLRIPKRACAAAGSSQSVAFQSSKQQQYASSAAAVCPSKARGIFVQ